MGDDLSLATYVHKEVARGVAKAMEARSASTKAITKKLTPAEQPCKHCRKAGQFSLHPKTNETKCFMNPIRKGCGTRPEWAKKKLKKLGITFVDEPEQ